MVKHSFLFWPHSAAFLLYVLLSFSRLQQKYLYHILLDYNKVICYNLVKFHKGVFILSEKVLKALRIDRPIIDYIENEIEGDDFTKKFHNLVYLCIDALPKTKSELNRLNNTIKNKSSELNKINESIYQLNSSLWEYKHLLNSLDKLKTSVDKVVNFCNNLSSN